ncbi:hypothetical protein ACFYT3_27585 [Nocardia amikacinitolerans]|uniref:hypothetical protein n=1 Tax=Nocardia amikacinitolerans TaxID=756689 RepID=UPI0020A5D68F|nr:hypothetical protein [Nocardia amikacinitolerans]MCP2291232.1 hypothetical protein [Nocardia amikacinitolerans]
MSYPYGSPEYGYPPAPPGYPPPGYGFPPSAPSGATTITAAVLTLVASALALFFGVVSMALASTDESATPFLVISLVVVLVSSLYGFGAVLMLRRKRAGRYIVIVLATLQTIGAIVSIVLGGWPAVVGLLWHGSIAVLASLSSTGRWIDTPRRLAYPHAPAYPPYGHPPYPYY